MARIIASLLVISGVVIPELLSAYTSGYSSLTQYISELGDVAAPNRIFASYFSFLPTAVLVAAAVFILWVRHASALIVKFGLLLMLGVAIGYLGAVIFPCEQACRAITVQQSMHNLAGLIEYVGALSGLFLITLGFLRSGNRGLFQMTAIALVFVLLGFLLMLTPDLLAMKGLAQRIADYTIFLWFAAALLQNSTDPS